MKRIKISGLLVAMLLASMARAEWTTIIPIKGNWYPHVELIGTNRARMALEFRVPGESGYTSVPFSNLPFSQCTQYQFPILICATNRMPVLTNIPPIPNEIVWDEAVRKVDDAIKAANDPRRKWLDRVTILGGAYSTGSDSLSYAREIIKRLANACEAADRDIDRRLKAGSKFAALATEQEQRAALANQQKLYVRKVVRSTLEPFVEGSMRLREQLGKMQAIAERLGADLNLKMPPEVVIELGNPTSGKAKAKG